MLKLSNPIVSAQWLHKNLMQPDLIVLDATLKKAVDTNQEKNSEVSVIKSARFLDIKKIFSIVEAPFPNTMVSPEEFEEKARGLGINNESAIVVYDRYGYYSAPRVWWMFKTMGFDNVAVLDGGLPHWKELGYPIQESYSNKYKRGNFSVAYISGLIHGYDIVLESIETEGTVILDARSHDRFLGTVAEPRKGLRSGHIPNSENLPYTSLLDGERIKSTEDLIAIFSKYKEKNLVFSCGSGITACILALGAELAGIKTKTVYDGSWTEWGSLDELPIEIG